jgi:hypothetical protein
METFTVNIRNSDDYGIQMVDFCPEVEWSVFQMVTKWLTMRKPDKFVRFSNGYN